MRDKCWTELVTVTVISTYCGFNTLDFLPSLKFKSELLILAVLSFQELKLYWASQLQV